MCGVCGIFNMDGSPVDRGLLQAMNARLVHRGPDDSGIAIHGHQALAHRRLSIIDLASGKQPISNESGDVVVALNGEIFNYRELTAQLRQAGHQFKTESDTEVLAHLYEERGLSSPDKLRGMFAYGVIDTTQDRMVVVRDRLGIKPLYWTIVGKSFLFASEIKALLAHPDVARTVDLNALAEYFLTRFVEAPNSIVAGIHKLRPGGLLEVTSSGVSETQYWELRPRPAHGSDAENFDAYRERLDDAIDAWMVADVPVGAFLSGGLDSSTLVAAMARRTSRRIQTFTARFSGSQVDESHHARRVAQHVGTDHKELTVEPSDPEELRRVFYHLEEPIGDPAVFPTYQLSRLAAEHVKVVMSGEGADEVNLGYTRYLRPARVRALNRLPALARSGPVRFAASRYSPAPVRQAYRLLSRGTQGQWADFTGLSPGRVNLFRPPVNSAVDRAWTRLFGHERLDSYEVSRPSRAWDLDRLHFEVTRTDLSGWLGSDLLLKVDKMTMASGLEARTPFLDHHFVEYAANLPSRARLGMLETKRYQRRYAATLLPDEILRRPQHGFIMPVSGFFAGLDKFVDATCARHERQLTALFTPDGRRRVATDGQLRWMLFALLLVCEELKLELPCV